MNSSAGTVNWPTVTQKESSNGEDGVCEKLIQV